MSDEVRIDDYLLPGVIEEMSVGGQVVIDKNKPDSAGNQQKVSRGYDDKTVSITLRLFDDVNFINSSGSKTRWDYLAELDAFYAQSKNGVPDSHIIVSIHTKSRNLRKVILNNLSSRESQEDDSIMVTIEMTEFIPAKYFSEAKNQSAVQSGQQVQQNANPKKTVVAEQEPTIDWKKNFDSGMNAGMK